MGKLNLLRAFLERYPKLSNVGITTDFLLAVCGAQSENGKGEKWES